MAYERVPLLLGDSLFDGNEAGTNGGHLSLETISHTRAIGCRFFSGTAGGDGGAIYRNAAKLEIQRRERGAVHSGRP